MELDSKTFAARRARIFEEMERQGGGLMILPAASEKSRNADNEYLFRQDSDYAYATGLDEPEGGAVLVARGGERRYILFVRPRDREKEIWNGFRVGVEGAKERLLADEAYTASELDAKLPDWMNGAATLWYRLGFDRAWDRRIVKLSSELRAGGRQNRRAPLAIVDSGRIVHELRLVKTPEEIAILRRAAAISAEAHMQAMRDGQAGRREAQVQAEIEYLFRRRGGTGPGYGTIVAAGSNSTILHYRAGDTVLEDGQVCLVDAAAEVEWYTADISRTFPVSGEFTPAQRDLYEACLEVQKKAIDSVAPGATLDGIHDEVVRSLTDAMIRLGLLVGSVDERVADKSFKKYFMHRTSHWLGLDVHDAGDYYVDGKPRPLVSGMVLTIEPGLYVATDDEGAAKELRGVGVRIEDDVLVTPEGHENLTDAAPKEVSEVQAVCVR